MISIPKAEYARRRKALMAQMEPNSIAILPAIFVTAYPALDALNIMQLGSSASAILSAVIVNTRSHPAMTGAEASTMTRLTRTSTQTADKPGTEGPKYSRSA